MSELRDMLIEAARRIFEDHPASASAAWPADLWAALESAGFDRALVPESQGGAGLGWSDAFELLCVAGKHVASVPLAEAMIGNWLIDRAGLRIRGIVSIAPVRHDEAVRLNATSGGWRIEGSLPRVPWGRSCTHVAVVCDTPSGPQLAVIECTALGVSIVEAANVAAEPRDTLVLTDVAPHSVTASPIDRSALFALAAISRSALIAGGIAKTLSLAVDYANLRVQFGRPIGKFQAIQQNLAILATEAVASKAASESGSEAIDASLAGQDEPIATAVAAATAKIRAGEAAGRAATIVHQVFGAIGFTEEHELHRYTKRLWSWRDEYGSEAYWCRRLGERMVKGGPAALWRTIASSTPAWTANEQGTHAPA